jgi:hypothetical protein
VVAQRLVADGVGHKRVDDLLANQLSLHERFARWLRLPRRLPRSRVGRWLPVGGG